MLTKTTPINTGVFNQILFLIFITTLSSIVFSGAGVLIASFFFNIDAESLTFVSAENIAAFKLIQVFSTVGTFLFPALIFRHFVQDKSTFFSLAKRPKLKSVLLSIVLFLILTPIVNYFIKINSQLSLPSYFVEIETWFKQLQLNQEKIIDLFTQIKKPKELLGNIFIMAVLPALSEELFFRGVLQNVFLKWTQNIYVAILITAIFFAVVHQQLYMFLPIMFLGAILGYFYFLTKNIWVPIIVHFVNNLVAVIAYFFQKNQEYETIGTTEGLGAAWLLLSAILTGAIFFLLYRKKINLS